MIETPASQWIKWLAALGLALSIGALFPGRMLEHHIKPAAKAAELGEGIGWHMFRCTYSCMLRELDVDIKVQQELLRHADIRTTINVYTQGSVNKSAGLIRAWCVWCYR